VHHLWAGENGIELVRFEGSATLRKVAYCLLLVLALGSLSSGAEPSPKCGKDRYPRRIVNVEMRNLTDSIPTRKLFVPKRDGFYRISLYMVTTKAVPPNCQCYWGFTLNWADDAGKEQWKPILGEYGNGPFLWAGATPPAAYDDTNISSIAFRANAGTPVTYNTFKENNPDGSTYEVFFTIEQLD